MPALAQSIIQKNPNKIAAFEDGKIGPVTDRAYPELHRSKSNNDETLGLRLGTFLVEPRLEISSIWSSNVNRSPDNSQSDFGVSLKPSLSFKSDWSRHEVSGKASGDITRFLESKEANINALDAKLNSRVEIRRDTRLDLSSGFEISSTRAGSGEVPSSAIGNRQDTVTTAGVALSHGLGRLQWRGSFDLAYNQFGNVDLAGGGTENNNDRNFWDARFALRTDYISNGAMRPFLQLNYTPRLYSKNLDRNNLKRSSKGLGIDLGLSFDDGAIWSGEIAATYAVRNPDEATLGDENILGLNGDLTWRPLETAEVNLSLATNLGETLSATESANRNWSAALDYEQSVSEFLNWKAGASIDFSDTSTGLEKTYGLTSAVEWEINRYVAWSVGYEGTWFDAKGTPSRDYNEQRVLTSIILSR